MSDAGKGSAPRPLSVPRDTFGAEYDRIFGARCGRCGRTVQLDALGTYRCQGCGSSWRP